MEKLLMIGKELTDDSETIRFLEGDGYKVLRVDNGTQGLEILQAESPMVAIVNHELEDGDGVDVLKQICAKHSSCEAILVTSGGEMEAAIEVLRAGALDYLHRPVDIELLRVALGRARERRGLRMVAEPPTILILEDHDTTRKRLVRVLEKENYNVLSADNGDDGMRLIRENRVDLVMSDIKMPHKDGLEVLHEIKSEGADVEVIVVTGYGDEEIVVQALRDGAVNFLRKPIDIEQMLLAIQKALDFQTARRSLAYRNRDVEIMQELVVRLTNELELIVEAPWSMGTKAKEFLVQLIDSLPIGIVVAGPDRKILFANRAVVETVGESPEMLATDWLEQVGVTKVSDSDLDSAFKRALDADAGSIETLLISKWSFLVMTPLKMLRPDGSERFVALAIRGERRYKSDTPKKGN